MQDNAPRTQKINLFRGLRFIKATILYFLLEKKMYSLQCLHGIPMKPHFEIYEALTYFQYLVN